MVRYPTDSEKGVLITLFMLRNICKKSQPRFVREAPVGLAELYSQAGGGRCLARK